MSTINPPRVATIADTAAMEPYCRLFSQLALRHLIFNASPTCDSKGRVIAAGNGLEQVGAILRVGRRVLLDLDRFDSWLLSHRSNAPHTRSDI